MVFTIFVPLYTFILTWRKVLSVSGAKLHGVWRLIKRTSVRRAMLIMELNGLLNIVSNS